MVAAVSAPVNPKRAPTPTRPPLLPSESDNAIAPPRRPKPREVTSRYLSSSSSSSTSSSSTTSFSSSSVSSTPRRCISPMVTRTVSSATVNSKRSQSVERRPRQGTPRPTPVNGGGNEAPVAQRMLFTATRSLSVSFQGESFSIQVKKPAPAPSPSPATSLRKSTPERRKVSTPMTRGNGNSDQPRWPGKVTPAASCMNRSLDFGDSAARKLGSPASVVRSLQDFMVDARASSLDGTTTRSERNGDCGSESQHELVPSDNESVTSGSSSGAQELGRRSSRALVVPARFWQDPNNRKGSPLPRNGGNRAMALPSKLVVPKKSSFDSPMASPRGVVNSRGQVSPIHSAVRPASPSKLATSLAWSPSRGVSPSRVRNGATGSLSNRLGNNEPSVLSFAVDVPRGKVGENRIADAHSLRLAYNRLMQWRFVNARADASLSAQTLNAEKSLYFAWVTTSILRESVRAKRTELQLLKQRFKLISILEEQMRYLEDWASMDRMYSSSLSGAIEALKASTLRLPVVSGAKADVLNVKDAIFSAMDVMQAMASSICLLSPKVGHVNSLVVEVANVSAKERALLEECDDLLSMITTMQVRECSLRTHISQLECLP